MIKKLLLKWVLNHLHIVVTKQGITIVNTSYGLLKTMRSKSYPFNTVTIGTVQDGGVDGRSFINVTFDLR